MPKFGNNYHTQQGQLNWIETTIVLGTTIKKNVILSSRRWIKQDTFLWNCIICTVWTANDAVFQVCCHDINLICFKTFRKIVLQNSGNLFFPRGRNISTIHYTAVHVISCKFTYFRKTCTYCCNVLYYMSPPPLKKDPELCSSILRNRHLCQQFLQVSLLFGWAQCVLCIYREKVS